MLRRMAEEIIHRGPDDGGLEIDGACGLAFRRLSIIDLSAAGHQPMRSEDGRVTVVFNGEIYNHRELRDELEADGARFRSRADTEVLLHLFLRRGTAMLSALEGMFAFAIWDARRETLFLARDRLGIKPLYVYQEPGRRILFASEIKSIVADQTVPRRVDPTTLVHFLTFGHSSAPRTMFSGIEKLEPGHQMVVSDGVVSKTRYWNVLDVANTPLVEEPVGAVRQTLQRAVASHMVSDVPVGAFLSGGVDSSAVVAFMSDVSPPVRTFTAGFDVGGSYDELDSARLIARTFATAHHERTVAYGDAADLLSKLVYHYDEPFADAAALPTYLISRFAREHVKVVMSGEGSDELFGGYRRYVLHSQAERVQGLPAPVRRASAAVLELGSRWRVARRLLGFLSEDDDEATRYARFLAVLPPDLTTSLLGDEGLAQARDYDPFSHVRDRFAAASEVGLDVVNRQLYADLTTWMVDTYLEKVDKATMAVGLEARVPFLDRSLVELAFRIPGSLKIRALVTKYPLKRALVGIVPLQTLVKPKHGFSVPVDRWLAGPLRDLVQEVLLSDSSRSGRWLRRSVVREVCERHFDGTQVNGSALWILLNFELWLRRFIDP